jgi:H+/gluconate symporter-like permease
MATTPSTILTNARLAIGVIVPLITVLFFFFQLQTDIKANSEHIDRNTASITKMENKLEGLEESMNELLVDIRVMTVQMDTMMKTMERMEKKLEKE